MSSWVTDLAGLVEQGKQSVLVTIVEARGSTPRELGARMIVTNEDLYGTVGGGNLEYLCIGFARERLISSGNSGWHRSLRRFPLGASLGQCCGGLVVVLLEYITSDLSQWVIQLRELLLQRKATVLITGMGESDFTGEKWVLDETTTASTEWCKNIPQNCISAAKQLLSSAVAPQVSFYPPSHRLKNSQYLFEQVHPNDFPIRIFGAGHVGQALVNVLSGLSCEICWVDNRDEQFPLRLPGNVCKVINAHPEDEVVSAPTGTYYLVMTHDHQLDQRICEQILLRADFQFCGLIGSQSKRRKFEHRLRAKGLSESAIRGLTCPIGIKSISGKQPAEIAIAVAAQLLEYRQASKLTTVPSILSR